MSNVRKVTVRFLLDREEDRRAYALLCDKGKAERGSISRAIVAAVDAFFARQEQEEALLARIQEIVERGVRANALPTGNPEPGDANESEDWDAALDFCDSL